MKNYRTYDEYLQSVLVDPKEAALYLEAVVEENDPRLLMTALAQVARAHGMTKTARKAGVSRMGLHKALSRAGNPRLRTFLALLAAAGLKLSFVPA